MFVLFCLQTMCQDRDWFDIYEKVSGGSILMGNNVVCKIMGIGTIQIKCHYHVIRNLTNVRHIPNLKKNLILLSNLDSIRCIHAGEGGVCKFQKAP